ncbi:MAG: hypothetical protein AVDCRST_MAG60-439, partial [uncultured Nocardioides sp.]
AGPGVHGDRDRQRRRGRLPAVRRPRWSW